MKNSGFEHGGGYSKGHGYLQDSDWEVAEEISPDPFSEEEHSRIHARRYSQVKNRTIKKSEDSVSNFE